MVSRLRFNYEDHISIVYRVYGQSTNLHDEVVYNIMDGSLGGGGLAEDLDVALVSASLVEHDMPHRTNNGRHRLPRKITIHLF